VKVRHATAADAAACAAIYEPVVRDTAISFEEVPPSVDETARRIGAAIVWLVAEAPDGEVVGYAYSSAHRERAAYRWAVDVSAYIGPEARGRGVGRQLYTQLLADTAALGYRRAYAGIALPNAASVALHEAMGFRPVGVYERVGWKLGRWHDVGWWQRDLGGDDPFAPPSER
jgi:phosphinothricin acetyltransferase